MRRYFASSAVALGLTFAPALAFAPVPPPWEMNEASKADLNKMQGAWDVLQQLPEGKGYRLQGWQPICVIRGDRMYSMEIRRGTWQVRAHQKIIMRSTPTVKDMILSPLPLPDTGEVLWPGRSSYIVQGDWMLRWWCQDGITRPGRPQLGQFRYLKRRRPGVRMNKTFPGPAFPIPTPRCSRGQGKQMVTNPADDAIARSGVRPCEESLANLWW